MTTADLRRRAAGNVPAPAAGTRRDRVAAGWRLARLYLVSRRVPMALALIAGLGALLWAALHWHWNIAGGAAARQVIPLTIEAGAAAVIAVTTYGPFGEPERAAGRWLPARPWVAPLTVPVTLLTAPATPLVAAGCELVAWPAPLVPAGGCAGAFAVAGWLAFGWLAGCAVLVCAVLAWAGLAWAGPGCDELGGAEVGGAEVGCDELRGAEADGAEADGAEVGGAEADGAEADGAEADGAEADGAEAGWAEVGGAVAGDDGALGWVRLCTAPLAAPVSEFSADPAPLVPEEAGFVAADARPARRIAKISAAAIPPQTHKVTLRAQPKARVRVADPSTARRLHRETDNHPYLLASSVRAEPSAIA